MYKDIALCCPVCGAPLTEDDRRLFCSKNHSFDIARQGYINLLPVQNKHSLSPGDTAAMLRARRSFLDSGLYQPVSTALCERIGKYARGNVLADIGCGEGYYTAQIEKNCACRCIGIDIAKEAAKMACARSKSIVWAVATASKLPIENNSTDIVTAVFSLFVNNEYARILRRGGIVVEITAGNGHLRELKELIYDEVFEQNKQPAPCGEEFVTEEQTEEKFTFTAGKELLQNLLMMTPHAHRIKADRGDPFSGIEEYSLTADIIIRVLRKK